MNNLEKYCSALEQYGVDGVLLTSRCSRRYAAGFDIAEGIAIVSQAGCRYFTDGRYIESAEKNLHSFEVRMVGADKEYPNSLNQAIDEFGIRTLGFEEEYLTVAELNKLQKTLRVGLKPCQKLMTAPRAVKEPEELEKMKAAQAITDKSFDEVLAVIRAGMTEKELMAELVYRFYRNGADNVSFDPIVISGPKTSLPHGIPSDRRIQPGEFITMDIGVLYDGYCSDMTRTVALGYVTDEMKTVYDTVLRAQTTAIAATRAGITGRELDLTARRVIEDAGYGAYFGHSYGHSLGLEIHESPNASRANPDPLPAGAVISAEPGIYLPGKFGVRIEDVVVLTDTGCVNLTKSPKELRIL